MKEEKYYKDVLTYGILSWNCTLVEYLVQEGLNFWEVFYGGCRRSHFAIIVFTHDFAFVGLLLHVYTV